MYLYQTGRQQEISIAELEALSGSARLSVVSDNFVMLNKNIPLKHVGGSIKKAQIIDGVTTTDIAQIKKKLLSLKPSDLFGPDDKKYNFGISCFGFNFDDKTINGLALELKKKFKKLNSPTKLRVVPTKNQVLSNAQVLHNKLHLRSKGAELLIINNQNTTTFAITTDTQNLDNYTARDMERPNTDTYVGMLPIKLAQIIINIASISDVEDGFLLDPFCGLGTVLQEAVYANKKVYGTDVSKEMVRASKENLEWFMQQKITQADVKIELGDATSYQWSLPISAVATEMFLGEPLNVAPSPQKVDELNKQSNVLLTNFLTNIRPQLKPGAVLCIASPCWRVNNSFSSAVSVDELNQLGYNYASFQHVDIRDLVYIRQNQHTGRRILVLVKK